MDLEHRVEPWEHAADDARRHGPPAALAAVMRVTSHRDPNPLLDEAESSEQLLGQRNFMAMRVESGWDKGISRQH